MDCHFLPPKNAIDTRPYESEKAGIRPFEKGEVRFGYADTTFPILLIDKLLFDDDGTSLPVGYYEVGLSNDKNFLLLSQSKQIVAKVPVYMYEEIKKAKTEEELKKEEKKLKEKQKLQDAITARLTSKRFDIYKAEKRLDVWAKLLDYDDNYFIIEYRRYEEHAYGAIPKKY